MYYIIHVVKKWTPGVWDTVGEFIQAESEDLDLISLRCQELNEGINLRQHHYCEIRQSAEGLTKSEFYNSNL